MYELVHHLVENGVFLNGIDIDGKTPLYYAADRGNPINYLQAIDKKNNNTK